MLSDDVVCETVKICEINVYNNVNINYYIHSENLIYSYKYINTFASERLNFEEK